MVIVSGSAEEAARFVRANRKANDRVLCFEEELAAFAGCDPLAYGKENDPATLSAGLFAALRILDDPAIGTVYARCPQGGGMACAVRNRLSKAAAFRVIDPGMPKLTIGITGGTGCGKTTLLNAIREKGGRVIDCDAVYHRLLETDRALLTAIENTFPGTVENGVLQRKKLGALVFADPEKLKALSSVTGPVICAEVRRLAEEAPGLAAIDAIGLFEGGLDRLCHTTVAVTAPMEARIARLIERDGITAEYARSRIAAQKPEDFYTSRCAHALCNDGTKEEFRAKCLAFLQSLGIM